jgi:uncharacterized RDD family membrane protein YckC
MPLREQPLDSVIQVITPENIAFEYRVAGPFRRLGAFLLDLLLIFFLIAAIGIVLSFTVGMISPGLVTGLLAISAFIVIWFYGGFFETFMNGQTPGKMVCSLRVLTDQGQPINGLQAVLRNLLRLGDLMFGAVELVVVSLNSRYQRAGDLVCGTIVVVEDRQWLTGVAKLDDPRAIQLAAYLPPNFVVSKTLAKALATYVERRRFFSVPRRREVAKHLAVPLLELFGLPPDTSYDLLLCALYYRTFIADRSQDERMFAEAQAAFAAANPFQGLMNTGQPYQKSPYPYGLPGSGPPPAPLSAAPLPQQQLVGAGDFGTGGLGTGTIQVGGSVNSGSLAPPYGADRP